jgi:hypothetical protein
MNDATAGRSSSAPGTRESETRNYPNIFLSVLGRLLIRPASEHAPKPSEKPASRFGALLAACEPSTGRLTVAQLREFEPSGEYCLFFLLFLRMEQEQEEHVFSPGCEQRVQST